MPIFGFPDAVEDVDVPGVGPYTDDVAFDFDCLCDGFLPRFSSLRAIAGGPFGDKCGGPEAPIGAGCGGK
jgi:hypothetical protein